MKYCDNFACTGSDTLTETGTNNNCVLDVCTREKCGCFNDCEYCDKLYTCAKRNKKEFSYMDELMEIANREE